ncbi:MAG: cbb3-type cytochrome c oxidase subunit I, partial [Chthoniobacterales bacterium]
MANPTSTLKEIGTELAPAPPGQEHGSPTAWIQDLIFTVDHKKLGFMYLGSGWLFFIAGGILAVLIRTQIAVPNNHFLDGETFNGVITMHGTTMIFFFAMLMVFGLINYIVPLQIGARDMAFPRLNAF